MKEALIPFYRTYNLGTNLEDTRDKLFSLPYDQYKPELVRMLNVLADGSLGGNPGLAAEFAHYMVGMSTAESLMNQGLTILDIGLSAAATGGLLKLGRGMVKGVKIGPDVEIGPNPTVPPRPRGTGPSTPGADAALLEDVKTAHTDMVKAATTVEPTNLPAIIEHTGDVHRSAIAQVDKNLYDKIKGCRTL